MKLFLSATIVAVIAFSSQAFAGEGCKNVKIKVKNAHKDRDAKVYDIKYMDGNKERNESGVSGKVIEYGGNAKVAWTRTLDKVGRENTKVKVKYAHTSGRGYGSKKWSSWSSSKKCTDGTSYTVTIK